MQAFIKFVAGSFDISQRGTHVGLLTYSDSTKIALAFNALQGAGYTKEAFNRLVDAVPHQGGRRRRIDLALRLAFQQLFTAQFGVRADARKVCWPIKS